MSRRLSASLPARGYHHGVAAPPGSPLLILIGNRSGKAQCLRPTMHTRFDQFRFLIPRHRVVQALGVALLATLLTAVSGCKSGPDKGGSGFASVIISGNTPGQVLEAAEQIFIQNGYVARADGPNRVVCEKQGSGWNNVAYGNWIGDTPVWQRVRLTAVALGEAVVRLDCQAYYVRDRGQTTEEELPISKMRSGPYQKLLKKTARHLGAAPQ